MGYVSHLFLIPTLLHVEDPCSLWMTADGTVTRGPHIGYWSNTPLFSKTRRFMIRSLRMAEAQGLRLWQEMAIREIMSALFRVRSNRHCRPVSLYLGRFSAPVEIELSRTQ